MLYSNNELEVVAELAHHNRSEEEIEISDPRSGVSRCRNHTRQLVQLMMFRSHIGPKQIVSEEFRKLVRWSNADIG
jgi:hypothetical protein